MLEMSVRLKGEHEATFRCPDTKPISRMHAKLQWRVLGIFAPNPPRSSKGFLKRILDPSTWQHILDRILERMLDPATWVAELTAAVVIEILKRHAKRLLYNAVMGVTAIVLFFLSMPTQLFSVLTGLPIVPEPLIHLGMDVDDSVRERLHLPSRFEEESEKSRIRRRQFSEP